MVLFIVTIFQIWVYKETVCQVFALDFDLGGNTHTQKKSFVIHIVPFL